MHINLNNVWYEHYKTNYYYKCQAKLKFNFSFLKTTQYSQPVWSCHVKLQITWWLASFKGSLHHCGVVVLDHLSFTGWLMWSAHSTQSILILQCDMPMCTLSRHKLTSTVSKSNYTDYVCTYMYVCVWVCLYVHAYYVWWFCSAFAYSMYAKTWLYRSPGVYFL